jgi:tripartite-type tricarboxylate transporter receptor subunit TctC
MPVPPGQTTRRALLAVLSGGGIGFCGVVHARTSRDPWPSRPLRLLIPAPPGQQTDLAARLVAQLLSDRLKRPVIPENRAGAGGRLATDAVAKAAPDGYTLLAAGIGPVTFAPLLVRTPYDIEADLAPVARLGTAPFVVLVRADSLAPDLAGLTAMLGADRTQYSYCSSGIGSAQHLVAALFLARTQREALHVPFQGSGPALAALTGGQVDFCFDTPAAGAPLVQSGRLRALAVTSARGSALLPGVPTVVAAGGPPDLDVVTWFGVMAPADTPPSVVDRLHVEIQAAAASSALGTRFAAIGLTMENVDGPAAFRQELRAERAAFAPLVQQLGLRAE